MERWGPDLCLVNPKSIPKVIRILNEMGMPMRVNRNVRARSFFVVPDLGEMLGFVVVNVRVNLGGVEYPPEYALYFGGKDYRVKVKEGRLVCNLDTLVALVRYLEL